MKEKIYTIPITEIFEEKCFCPFCQLHNRLSEEEIKYALGAAMMEPDYRAKTNKLGFCREHMRELNSLPKALAMSLVLDTHLDRVNEALDKKLDNSKKSFFNKSDIKGDIASFVEEFNSFNETCAICDKINYTFSRYMDTFIYMLEKNGDFLEKVLQSEGFCFPHYTMILNAAKENLSPDNFVSIISKLNSLQKEKYSKYKKDIKDFIESFDYKNAGKPSVAPGDTVIKTSYLLNGEFEKLKKKLDDI